MPEPNNPRYSVATTQSRPELLGLQTPMKFPSPRLSAPPAMGNFDFEEANKSERLVLSKFILYETKAIDRTSVSELNVIEDDAIYSKQEINDILSGLGEGNRVTGGLNKVLEAYGIVGFIRFTEGFYMSLIMKRSPAALIGGHYIYNIDETKLLSINSQSKPEKNSEEQRYISTFQNVDLAKNFYFSYTYDITHTLQHNMTRPPNRRNFSYNEMFVWNHYLLETGFRSLKNQSDWILPVIYGFVTQSKISVYGRNIFLTLIARRSRYFAGARFRKRGTNDQGYVANDVESEQIVAEMSTTSFHFSGNKLFDNPNYSSYVQHRGSIPLFWSQDLANMVPKPPISINFRDPFFSAAALHFDNMFKRYGAPIIVLNLIKMKEKNPRESILGDEFAATIEYLNQFLPPNCLKYVAWDMSKAKKSDVDVIGTMEKFSEEFIAETGFFHSGPEPSINVLRREEKEGKPQSRRRSFRQNGVIRTNCIDCLDRTNAAQLIIGKCALAHQLYALGIIDTPSIPYDSDVVNMLTEMYHVQGDTIALQYGGSNLVSTMDAYRKINAWSNQSRDVIESIKRYYNNAFTDAEKQDAINVFLGNFVPQKGKPSLWELESDFTLHFEDPRFRRPRRSYINWWTKDALVLNEGKEDSLSQQEMIPRRAPQYEDENDPYTGYWIEHYRPSELTSFSKLFAYNINSTAPIKVPNENYDYSPFTVRQAQQNRLIIRGVRNWFAVPTTPTQEQASLNPNVSATEEKEYKRYIKQFRNVALASTPTGNDDPSLTNHSDYHNYFNYAHIADGVDPTRDLHVHSYDHQVYNTHKELPTKVAVMQTVGNQYHSNSATKNRYKDYENWIKTGRLGANGKGRNRGDSTSRKGSHRDKIKNLNKDI
ncbi:7646_t:CDS:10 [Paraglomus occultum]|uniref:7646_t:CDS:1 n=1 Tax=Paraglomus occultum TaxID=144539 RepID=A0A9N8VSE1_9GLOM|nr:7646_t:CDS:10 [Paraglomus occultum]